jgi:hypothetical protein
VQPREKNRHLPTTTRKFFRPEHPINRTPNMSDSGEIEVATAAYPVLPKDVAEEIGSIKLFNKWSYDDVEVKDISLT